MSIKIKNFLDIGIPDKERIVFEVLADVEVGYYIVFDGKYNSNRVPTNRVFNTYWFPDKKVKTGDLVVLYTKTGKQNEKQNPNGTTSHFFYWGLEQTILNKADGCVLLVESKGWSAKSSTDFITEDTPII